jgi:cytochrome c553
MTERTLEEAAALKRSELATLHADEMSAALRLPAEGMPAAVAQLRSQHMRELAAWVAANK